MAHVVTSIVQTQAQAVGKKLKHPRRTVDEQGRNVQFPQWGGLTASIVMMIIFGVLFIGMGLLSLTSNSSDKNIMLGTFFGFALMVFLFAYYFYRISRVTYYEDEYGFETLTPFLHKKVAISYNDIASWTINQQRGLQVKSHSKQKVIVSLPYFRPLILLNTLVTMELEGRIQTYTSEDERNRVVWEIDSEFCEHANKVLEEMEKTGATIYIPER